MLAYQGLVLVPVDLTVTVFSKGESFKVSVADGERLSSEERIEEMAISKFIMRSAVFKVAFRPYSLESVWSSVRLSLFSSVISLSNDEEESDVLVEAILWAIDKCLLEKTTLCRLLTCAVHVNSRSVRNIGLALSLCFSFQLQKISLVNFFEAFRRFPNWNLTAETLLAQEMKQKLTF